MIPKNSLEFPLITSVRESNESRPPKKFEFDRQPMVVDACLGFARSLGLPKLDQNSNFVFSPLSLRLGLSLAAAGSDQETLDQFLTFLGSSTREDVGHAAAKLLNNFQLARPGSDDGPSLCFANGIWVDQATRLLPSFQNTASSIYNAAAETVDFRQNPQEAARKVNAWIQQSTNGRINNLIPPRAVDRNTNLILANGLFLRGPWDEPFDKLKTQMDAFRLMHGGATKMVPFMTKSYQTSQFLQYFDGLKVLRLPYQRQGGLPFLPQAAHGPTLSLLLYLPNHSDGLSTLIERATTDPAFFHNHYPREKAMTRLVKVPKFKINSRFDAAADLRSFGLQLPFSSSEANFQQMTSTPLSYYRLHIASVLHGTDIEVDEKGTTASAATAIILKCYVSMGPTRGPPRPLLDFVADHPFLFAIRDDDTGAILFLGHIADPSAE